ncbi:MAG: NAD(P)H-dependent oxidoreductase subunit E, partial [bacterium]
MTYRTHALLCAGAACISSGADEVQKSLEAAIKENGLQDEVKVVRTGCVGSCDLAPILIIEPDSVFYQKVKPKDAEAIVREHLLKGRVYQKNLIRDPDTLNLITTHADFAFFRKQMKIVLGNCGLIDPENIREYIARDGYQALGKVLAGMKPEEVIEELETSRLRGRGGAGFPTGRKWRFVYDAQGPVKYVVCNADEGDPGAFMDRSVLEGDPHRVLEAMAIAGYTVGAKKGFLYIRAEYPLAIRRVEMAIRQARQLGLLGDNILETGFSFDLEVRVGAGAFVCGEETALMASIQGRRGMPRPRPPFPAVRGLWNCPTLINNVETYANIVPILTNGGVWFSKIGTERSTGTKVFALAGKINNTGLVEVPMGMTLREIIYEIGGGIPGGKKFKAAQTGGPSGGCIPEQHLDISMEYDTLFEIGSMMGSGGLIVMDEDSCMVDVAKFFLEFCVDESCGKCPPCRVG